MIDKTNCVLCKSYIRAEGQLNGSHINWNNTVSSVNIQNFGWMCFITETLVKMSLNIKRVILKSLCLCPWNSKLLKSEGSLVILLLWFEDHLHQNHLKRQWKFRFFDPTTELPNQYCYLWDPENLQFYKHPRSFLGILKLENHSLNTNSSFLREVKLLVWAFWESISATLVQRVLYYLDFPEDFTIRMANFGDWQEKALYECADHWGAGRKGKYLLICP